MCLYLHKSNLISPDKYRKYLNILLIFIVSVYSIFFTTDIFLNYEIKTISFYILVLTSLIFFLLLEENYKKNHFEAFKKVKLFNYGFLLVIIMSLISTISNEYFIESLVGTFPNLISVILYIFSYIFVFLMTNEIKNFNLNRIFKTSIISFCLIGIIIIYQFFIYDFLTEKIDVKVFVSLGNRNYAVIPFTIMLILSIANYIIYNKKILLLPISIFYTIFLISLTRGAWISFLFSLLIIIILLRKMRYKFSNKNIKVLIVIFILIFFIVNILSNWIVIKRALNSLDPNLNYVSSDRINTWIKGIKLLNNFKRIFIGISPSVFQMYNIKYTNLHNQYVECLVSIGIFGLIGFILLIVSINYYAYKITIKNLKDIGYFWASLFITFKYLFNSINSLNFVYVLILFSLILNIYIREQY